MVFITSLYHVWIHFYTVFEKFTLCLITWVQKIYRSLFISIHILDFTISAQLIFGYSAVISIDRMWHISFDSVLFLSRMVQNISYVSKWFEFIQKDFKWLAYFKIVKNGTRGLQMVWYSWTCFKLVVMT